MNYKYICCTSMGGWSGKSVVIEARRSAKICSLKLIISINQQHSGCLSHTAYPFGKLPTGLKQWSKRWVVDHAYSLRFYSLWLPTQSALLRKSKNRASFLITPEATNSSSSRECFGRPGMPWCHPCAWTAPAAAGSGAKATQPQCDRPLLHHALALAGCGAHPGKQRAGSVARTTLESLQLDEHQLCIVSKSKMLEHEAGNSKKQHEQSKCQRNEKYVQNCDRALGHFSSNIINRLSSKISNTWEEITKIFKDTIFVFWMLIWHKGVCMRECL